MNANLPATARLALYQGTKSTASGQYFCNERQFALPVNGNTVELLPSGAVAFEQIAAALKAAEKFIWIADWQMAFDVELVGRGEKSHPGRLWKIFEELIKTKPVQIRVLLYRSVKDSQPGTYDARVARQLNAINKRDYPGKLIVIGQGPTSAQNDSWEYSHHQKFVVIDGQVAFLGGIDLTYGRMETPEFDVVVDPGRFVLNDMYNPCATRVREMSPGEKELVKQGFAEPYSLLLEEGCQPRMPWQDVHIKISGPAAVDVHRNFVRRWNMVARRMGSSVSPKYESPERIAEINTAWLGAHGATDKITTALASSAGQALVQIVRSVSSAHLRFESSDSNGSFRVPDDLSFLAKPSQRAVWEDCLKSWRDQHQDNILNAMVNCIRSAEHYIYIETQFFISDFGQAGPLQTRKTRAGEFKYYPVDSKKIGNENDGIKNTILAELAKRIDTHISAGTNFHVYLVLPVHPEGSISDGSVWKQHWLALATIHHGTNSLVGRIKRSLTTRGKPASDWNKYLTVLNMRNYGVAVQYARDPKTYQEDYSREIGRYVVTEQIYIHSKLLIVDDAVAIVGSANINDRSLTGNGDTEIAAVVVDTEDHDPKDLGNPQFLAHTRKFARELRRSLWQKHFGFALDGEKYFRSVKRAEDAGVKPPYAPRHPPRVATTEKSIQQIGNINWADILDKPCDPKTVTAIQKIASANQRAYETVFTHLPRNGMQHFDDILKHFSCPYPVAAEADAQRVLRQAEFNRVQSMSLLQRNAMLSPDQKAQLQAEIDRKRDQDIAAVPRHAGQSTLGVVPPALQKAYMTKSLLPHQQQALQVPMSAFHNRYVTYEGDTVHDISTTIDYLRSHVTGFLVLAPLNWGEGAEVDGDVDGFYGVDLAQDNKAPTDAGHTS
ncbi:MAG: phospholipase active site motif protein 6 [Rhodocyclales bacterium]|nr:phospholipase active site motif protein 6 [Rhodocyclales bacterium]